MIHWLIEPNLKEILVVQIEETCSTSSTSAATGVVWPSVGEDQRTAY